MSARISFVSSIFSCVGGFLFWNQIWSVEYPPFPTLWMRNRSGLRIYLKSAVIQPCLGFQGILGTLRVLIAFNLRTVCWDFSYRWWTMFFSQRFWIARKDRRENRGWIDGRRISSALPCTSKGAFQSFVARSPQILQLQCAGVREETNCWWISGAPGYLGPNRSCCGLRLWEATARDCEEAGDCVQSLRS